MRTPAPAVATLDQRAIRQHNLAAVLRRVAEHGPRSRAMLAVETGLTKTTVSSLVAELIELGLMRETGAELAGGTGRPARLVELAADGACALGLEISESYLAALAIDLTGAIRYERIVRSSNRELPAAGAVARLGSLVQEARAELAAAGLTPSGATVAVTGLVDSARGRVVMSPNFGWLEVSVGELLAAQLGDGIPIYVENDANLAALAEAWQGAGRAVADFLYVHGLVRGLGVGGGIVIGGDLYRGATGFGAEIGHVTVDPAGPRCTCGNRGCLQLYVGQEALARRAGVAEGDFADFQSSLAALVERATAREPVVLAALAETAHWLAEALCSATNLLNCAAVVLGGYFGSLGRWLVAPLQAEIDERVFASRWSPCRVLISELGADVALRGAAALTLREVLANPAGLASVAPARAV